MHDLHVYQYDYPIAGLTGYIEKESLNSITCLIDQ